jgi:hypothetical protein
VVRREASVRAQARAALARGRARRGEGAPIFNAIQAQETAGDFTFAKDLLDDAP